MLIVILLLITSLFFTPLVLAVDPPLQTSPANNSSVSSSKLEWSTPRYQLFATHPYRVQVDETADFSSVYRDYTTKNTYYSPSLTVGTWYWRLKVKDSGGIWSDWSDIWSFILTSGSPSSSTEPASSPSPTTTTTQSFTISNTPTQINSNQSFSTSFNLTLPNNPSSTFYLKGAFKKGDSSNYFGKTKVGSIWVANGSSYSNQLSITTDSSGNWSGNIDIQPDNNDTGFTGSGDYLFKVARYSDSGSGPSWSNEITINILGVKITSPIPVSSTKNSISPSTTPKTTSSSVKKATSTKVGTVAGIIATSTPSASIVITSPSPSEEETEIAGTTSYHWSTIAGSSLIILGLIFILYIYIKSRLKS